MVDKIDNVFAPERLRERWAKKSIGEKYDHRNNILKITAADRYEALYSNILNLMNKRFSGQEFEILESLMDELKIHLDLRSDQTNKHIITEEDITVVHTAIDNILAQIEDLVEVF